MTFSGRTWTSSRGTGRAGTLRPGLRGWRVSSGREATRGFWLLEEKNTGYWSPTQPGSQIPEILCPRISICRTNKTFYLGVLIFVTLGSQHTIIIYSFIVESYKSHLNDNSISSSSGISVSISTYNIDISNLASHCVHPDCYRCGHRETLIHTVRPFIILLFLVSRLDTY